MFGYVKTHNPELRVAEYEYYRAAYCGLCRSMGKCTGQCSRMTLSYDFAFLALIRLALTGDKVSEEKLAEFKSGLEKSAIRKKSKRRNPRKRKPAVAQSAE